MSDRMSALDCRPDEFIREVSPEAIGFYVNGLAGLYLPEEFLQEHGGLYGVRRWKPELRLEGKFGRFEVVNEADRGVQSEHEDVLVMGTTIGLHGLDRNQYLHSLRHYSLRGEAAEVFDAREIDNDDLTIRQADYGSTRIILGKDGRIERIRVDGHSVDYGRANAEGRQRTCTLFERLLAGTVEVVNNEPEPHPREQIIKLR